MNSKLLAHKYIRELLVALVFILGVAVFYGNTLQNGFINDDHGLIETNDFVHSLQYLPKVLTSCVWESANGTCNNSVNYHPIESLTYILTYQISSQPWIFHLINLIFFAICIFLVFIFTKLLTNNLLISFFAGLIFLIHPVNSEAVSWIAAGLSIQMTVFILLSIIFYFLYRQKNNTHYLTLVYIFYILGIFSKESAVFVPFAFLALDFIFFRQKISSFLKWQNLKPYFILIVLFAVYMGLRFWVLGSFVANSAYSQTYNFTLAQYIQVFFYLFASYIKEVFWPYPLNFFHTFHPSYQFWDFHFLTDILITLGFLGACFLAWKKRWIIVLLALIWFLIFLFPSLVFINSLGDNKFAERHAFTSIIGFSILMAMVLEWFWKNWDRGKVAVTVFMSIVTLLSFFYIYNHNSVWRNDISLDVDTLKYSPDADLIRYNLALAYRNRKDMTLAEEQLMQIIKRHDWENLYRAYYTLGDIYRTEGKYNEATSNFQTSIDLNPYHKEAYNNLGALFLEKGDTLKSVTSLCKAMQIDPEFKEASTNFNAAASRIQGLDNKSFILLYEQILNNSIFHSASGKNKITLKSKDCSYPKGCILIFSSNLPKNEFLFPFLTVGKTVSNEVVRTRYFEFNPETSEIALGIDRQFGSSKIHFWLPACNNVYYEVEITVK